MSGHTVATLRILLELGFFVPLQGQDGVDLEMNMNGTKPSFEDDEFEDVVSLVFVFTSCLCNFGDIV
jgi:hypothetical protein